MKKLLALLRMLLIVLLCLVLAINLWLIAARLLLHEELPRLAGFSQAVVLSGSMEPTFSAGDMLIFREQEGYEVGDVVIFHSDGALVTHRIVGVGEAGFVTQGDANNTVDRLPLAAQNIAGELVCIIPGVGRALLFLRSPLGLLLLVIAGIGLIEIPRLARRKGGGKDE